ncbi:MAG: sorbosone dehydrogenase family protein [Bryobacteraceae bacterium]|jgi:glucose/arabinose dehydrogenase
MRLSLRAAITGAALLACTAAIKLASGDADPKNVLTGDSAFASFTDLKPGIWRHITVNSLPKPGATPSSSTRAEIVPRPADVWPQAPPGFKVELFATGLANPRIIRRAPNGDLFVAETTSNGELTVFRGITADGKPEQTSTFITGLKSPFGLAFYPPGKNPQYIYVGNTASVVRIPYKNGDLKATGPVETIIPTLPVGGHSTRDVAFSPDGKKMFVSVGSGSNVAETDPDLQKQEFHRADILQYTPDGALEKVYASGIRNPVGIAINPTTGELWCSVNERDALGDNLVPDYITHVQEGGFYGWPWFYMGGNQDPRHEGKHPEMKDKAIVPDVLLQPHNASLQMTFYDGEQFPAEYRGDIFAAEHGSWNRLVRTGYEIVRVPLNHGHASGIYEDFLTGFVLPNAAVWGRPVGVATASDGSLMVTDDGSKSVWRVIYTGALPAH